MSNCSEVIIEQNIFSGPDVVMEPIIFDEQTEELYEQCVSHNESIGTCYTTYDSLEMDFNVFDNVDDTDYDPSSHCVITLSNLRRSMRVPKPVFDSFIHVKTMCNG